MPLSRTVAPYSSANREPDQPIHGRRPHPRPFIPVTNPLERVNREIKRRIDVVQVCPNDDARLRLVTAVLFEMHDEWIAFPRRYLPEGSMDKLYPSEPDDSAPTPQHHQNNQQLIGYTTPRDTTSFPCASRQGRPRLGPA
jgi:hypothetical protein